MVVDVDKLSDGELRTKLLEFGFPVMPITGTTRKVMTKKLKMLLENKNKIGGEGRRSLGRYSSEEESDTDIKATKKKESRRATMAAPVMQPPSSSPKVRKGTRFNETSESEITESPAKKEVRTTTTTTTVNRSQRIVRNAQDEFDTGSDSESDIANYRSPKNIVDGRGSPLKPTLSSSNYSPSKSFDSSYSSSRNVTFNANTSPSRYSTYVTPPSLASDYAAERLNQIRSRLSLNSPSYDKPLSSYQPAPVEKEETPFLSNFTKRLSTLTSQKNDYDYKNDIIKEHDINGSSGYARSHLSSFRTQRGRDPTYDYRVNRNNILKNNFVSFAVLAGAALFFVLLAILYMGMRSDTSVISADYIVPQCIKDDPASKRSVNCVPEENVATALHLLNVIKPELHKRAIAHKCFDPKIKPHMSETEIINFCMTNFAIRDINQIKRDLLNLLIMTFNNPEWGLSVVQTEDNNGVISEKDVAKDMEQVIFNFDSKLTSLVTLTPVLPWKCTFYNNFYLVFNSFIFVLLVFSTLYIINLAYRYYKYYNQKQKDEIGFMVEKIIDILQSNASEDGNDNFVVINHVRDMILPVGERQKKAGTWAKAVKFINENESRVRTEVQEVKGEPFEVWRWIGHTSVSTSSDYSEFKYRHGRRLVDAQYLIRNLMRFPHKFLKFCRNSDVGIKNEVRDGFISIFVLECTNCKTQHSVCSEEPETDYLSANVAFVAGVVSLGLGLYQLNELCNSLHIPGLTAESYNQYLDEIYSIYNDSVSTNDSFSMLPTLTSSTPNENKMSSYEKKRSKFLKELKKTPQQIEILSELTREQSDIPLWHKERRKRITASNFGRIYKLRDSTDRNNIVRDLLQSTFTGNTFTQWGSTHEIDAVKDFEQLLCVRVQRCGLFVHPDYPFLAASPDGLIETDTVVEIKCPYKARGLTPRAAIQNGLIKYALLDNGTFKLKREDKYFYQVQGQLLVTGREFCYFIVWTPNGLLYEKIMKDEDLWKKMLPKLEKFYYDYFLPALLEQY